MHQIDIHIFQYTAEVVHKYKYFNIPQSITDLL